MSRKRKTRLDKFYDYLFAKTPDWGARLLADWPKRRRNIHPELCDVRLLPNALRRVYSARGEERQCAKRLRLTLRVFRARQDEAESLLRSRLAKWLRSLPKERRIAERKKRWHDNSWVGRVSVTPWDSDFINPPNLAERWREARMTT